MCFSLHRFTEEKKKHEQEKRWEEIKNACQTTYEVKWPKVSALTPKIILSQ